MKFDDADNNEKGRNWFLRHCSNMREVACLTISYTTTRIDVSSYVEFFLVLGVNVRDAIASKMQEFGTNETFYHTLSSL